jgi:DNA-binding transcriptional MerR regulator
MRISELARRGGVALPTVKYYLSAGLLPPGRLTAANQATYDERHLYRLELIRTLLELGGLTVAHARAVLGTVDAGVPLPELLAVLDEVMTARTRHPGTPAYDRLADVAAAAHRLDLDELSAALGAYGRAAAQVAECDAAVVRMVLTRLLGAPHPEHGDLLARVVATVVLGQAAEVALCGRARRQALGGAT